MYLLRRPASKAVLTIRELSASYRAYTNSLHNEQFILPHLHILHSSPLRRARVPELSYPALTCAQGGRLSSVVDSSPKQQSAFENMKSELAGRRVLTHFDDKRDLFLATDASEYGVGAVLFHQATPEVGSNIKAQIAEQVISYASRTLSAAERNYSQIEKEALAIIFGI